MTYFINLLTLSRIFLAAVIFLLLTRPEGYFLAFILFFVAGATDYFDGYLARKYNAVSEIGQVLKRRLLNKYKNIKSVSSATIEDLMTINGINEKIAQEIKITLN